MKSLKRIAVVSMFEVEQGLGLASLVDLAKAHGDYVGLYEPRVDGALPALENFDVLLSSGGPGDPTELGNWGQSYADLIEQIRVHNSLHPDTPKRAFLICHSFQVMSHIWGLGEIRRRPSMLWGVQPQIPDRLQPSLPVVFPQSEFRAMESRFFQVLPTHDMDATCDELGLVIAARDTIGALTAWQTRDGHIAATQFHPEASSEQVNKIACNPPVGDNQPAFVCGPAVREDTRQHLACLPLMQQVLIDFVTKVV